MIVHNVAQGTAEWRQLRMGIPTASEFKKILSPTGKFSTQADGYANHLLAESILGFPPDEFTTKWMDRGTELESEAVKAYEFLTDRVTEKVGFITTDDGRIGASPDRLIVGEPGLLEIKCPKHSTHVGYMLTEACEDEYRPQLQGQLWITGRVFVDIVSYCPQMPTIVIRVTRDEEYIAKLSDAVGKFADRLVEKRAWLEQRYGKFISQVVKPPAEIPDALGITDADVDAIWNARATA